MSWEHKLAILSIFLLLLAAPAVAQPQSAVQQNSAPFGGAFSIFDNLFELLRAFFVQETTLAGEQPQTAVETTASGSLTWDEMNSNTVLLKARSFVPAQGISQALSSRLAAASPTARLHVLMQFSHMPNEGELRELKQQRVELLAYIPNNAWYASLPAGKAAEMATKPFVRAIDVIKPEYKISEYLKDGKVGKWAINEGGDAVLVVMFHGDVTLDEAERLIEKKYGEVYSRIETLNALTVAMPKDRIAVLASEDSVQWIQTTPPPYAPALDQARPKINADYVEGVYGLDGSGVDAYVSEAGALWELIAGKVDDTHDDFGGRVTRFGAGFTADHATHVGGIIGGSGLISGGAYRGIAPNVNILSSNVVVEYNDVDGIENDYIAAVNTYGADVANNSYGYQPANYDRGNCEREGDYDAVAELFDYFVTGSLGKRLPIVFAAGNERGYVDVNGVPYCGNYNTIMSTASGKNVITVGATTNLDSVALFSSWGPVDDGRIKPDVVAPGSGIDSTRPGDTYGPKSGTSMAAPMVTGSIALMLQKYRQLYGSDPLPSTLKAILINTAQDFYSPGPDYNVGYGMIDVNKAIGAIIDKNFREDSIAGSMDVKTYSLFVPAGTPELKVTLAWDDPPGNAFTTQQLVNNLDLTLISPSGSVYYPWVLDPSKPSVGALRGVDYRNNVEQVQVSNPAFGTWLIRVSGTSVQQLPQTYSVVFKEPPRRACNDGRDNDGDGLIDYPSDTTCTSYTAGSEGSNWPTCCRVKNIESTRTLFCKSNIPQIGPTGCATFAGPYLYSYALGITCSEWPTCGPDTNITSPADGTACITSGAPINFTGTATSVVGATLTGSALRWGSSIDGQLGSGNSISATLSQGVHTVTLTATDGNGFVNKDTILVGVGVDINGGATCPGTPPTISGLPDQNLAEDSGLASNLIDLWAYASDAESPASALVFTIISETNSSVVDCAVSSNRYVSCTTAANQTGFSDVTVQVSDGSLTSTDTFRVTVTQINDPPTIAGLPDKALEENSGMNINLIDLWVFASDIETADANLLFTIISETNPTVAGCSINAGRYIDCNVQAGQSGFSDVTVQVSDGSATAADTFRVTVTQVNDPPIINSYFPAADPTITEEQQQDFNVTASDPDGDPITITWYFNAQPAGTGNNYTYVADYNSAGVYYVQAVVSDDANLIAVREWQITVLNVNLPPSIGGLPNQSMQEDDPDGMPNAFDLDSYASDPDGEPLTYSITGSTCAGLISSITIDANNNIDIGAPAANANGNCDVNAQASDGNLSSYSTFTITVTPVNDAPLVSAIANVTMSEDTINSSIDLDNHVSDVDNTQAEMTWTFFGANVCPVAAPADASTYCSSGDGGNGDDWITRVRFAGQIDRTTGLDSVDGYEDHTSDIATVSLGNTYGIQVTIGQTDSWTQYAKVWIDWDHDNNLMDEAGYEFGSCNSNGCVVGGNITVPLSALPGSTLMRVSERYGGYPSQCQSMSYGEVEDYTVFVEPSDCFSVDINAATRIVTLAPYANWCGTETITFTATDPGGLLDSNTSTVTVSCMNDAPLVAITAPADGSSFIEGTVITFSGGATDVEDGNLTGSALQWTSSIDGAIGTSETFVDVLSIGTHTITLTATDSNLTTGSDTITVTITVINTPPTISVPDQNMPEDGVMDNFVDLWAYASDAQNTDEELAFSILSQSNTAVVQCSIDINRYVDCTGQPNQYGYSDVKVMVVDKGGLGATDIFMVNVYGVNDNPIAVISQPANGSGFSDQNSITFSGSATDLEDGILPGSALQWASSINGTLGTGGTIAATLSGGNHTITLTATDINGGVGTATISISVCATPQDGLTITRDMALCSGTYSLADTDNNGIITIDTNNVTLDCNNAHIFGNGLGFGIVAKGYIPQQWTTDTNGWESPAPVYNNQDAFEASISPLQNITIRNCEISDYNIGINLEAVSNARVENSTVYNSLLSGIRMFGARDSNISNNVARDNSLQGSGFGLWNGLGGIHALGRNISITNNKAYSNQTGIAVAGTRNTVAYNDTNTNEINIGIAGDTGGSIHHNTANSSTKWHGIFATLCKGTEIFDNNADNNPYFGIEVSACENAKVRNNTANYNKRGIDLRGFWDPNAGSSSFSTVERNTAKGNSEAGVQLNDSTLFWMVGGGFDLNANTLTANDLNNYAAGAFDLLIKDSNRPSSDDFPTDLRDNNIYSNRFNGNGVNDAFGNNNYCKDGLIGNYYAPSATVAPGDCQQSNTAPTATITAPAEGSSFLYGTWITFIGSGFDVQDGNLTGSSLEWSSNIDGCCSYGTQVDTNALSVGSHTITLAARDSWGAQGNAVLHVTITP